MEWKHRGRIITPADITFIQQLIEANPGLSRRKLSAKLCEAWDWRQPNGALRDMVCRGMLLMLDRAGQIQLPAIKKRPNNPLARRPTPERVLIDTEPGVTMLVKAWESVAGLRLKTFGVFSRSISMTASRTRSGCCSMRSCVLKRLPSKS